MNKPKLERCPFCGEEPIVWVKDGLTAIKCNNSDCWICPQTSFYTSANTAVTAWNDRAHQPDNKALTCEGCMYKLREGWNYEHCVRCARHWPDSYRRTAEDDKAREEGRLVVKPKCSECRYEKDVIGRCFHCLGSQQLEPDRSEAALGGGEGG